MSTYFQQRLSALSILCTRSTSYRSHPGKHVCKSYNYIKRLSPRPTCGRPCISYTFHSATWSRWRSVKQTPRSAKKKHVVRFSFFFAFLGGTDEALSITCSTIGLAYRNAAEGCKNNPATCHGSLPLPKRGTLAGSSPRRKQISGLFFLPVSLPGNRVLLEPSTANRRANAASAACNPQKPHPAPPKKLLSYTWYMAARLALSTNNIRSLLLIASALRTAEKGYEHSL